jgi:hypothetical protein
VTPNRLQAEGNAIIFRLTKKLMHWALCDDDCREFVFQRRKSFSAL